MGDYPVFVGHVTEFGSDLQSAVDTLENEYTVVISGARVVRRVTFLHFVAVYVEGETVLKVFEDPRERGTAAVFAPLPPNEFVPGSFSDGTMVLEGRTLCGTPTWNERDLFGQWSVAEGFDGGRLLPLLGDQSENAYGPAVILSSGLMPEGFLLKGTAEPRSHWVDPVNIESWGSLKHRYR